jgi:hypothetical protein
MWIMSSFLTHLLNFEVINEPEGKRPEVSLHRDEKPNLDIL